MSNRAEATPTRRPESTSTATVDSTSTSSSTASPTTSSTSDPSTTTSSSATDPSATTDAHTTGSTCEYSPCACVTDLGVGVQFNCALRSDQSVVCWGKNHAGQLGTGQASPNRPHFQEIVVGQFELLRAVDLDSHVVRACAVAEDQTVYCWGQNGTGAIFHSMPPTDEVQNLIVGPTQIEGVEGAIAVRTGQNFGCARIAGDQLTCWGAETSGALLVPARNLDPQEPAPPLGIHTTGPYLEGAFVDFEIGHNFGCMWSDIAVHCWGANNHGQLGQGAGFGPSSDVPLVVPLLDPIALPGRRVAVAVGRYHACAGLQNGGVWCWGRTIDADAGAPEGTNIPSPEPIAALDGQQVTHLSAGNSTTCARLESAEIVCWGGVAGEQFSPDAPNDGPFLAPARHRGSHRARR